MKIGKHNYNLVTMKYIAINQSGALEIVCRVPKIDDDIEIVVPAEMVAEAFDTALDKHNKTDIKTLCDCRLNLHVLDEEGV